MFPGPGAQVYRNEVNEVIGWDYPSEYEPDYEEMEREWDARTCDCGVDLKYEQCRCDEYCSRCGEFTVDSEGACANILCLDNLELLFPIRMGS